MLRVTLPACLALWLTCGAAIAQQAVCTDRAPGETRTTQFGVQRTLSIRVVVGGTERGYNGNDAGLGATLKAAYYRFRIVPGDGDLSGDWSLAIRDEQQRVQQILRAPDLANVPSTGLWSRFIKAGSVTFDLHAPPASRLAFTVVEAIVLPEGAGDIRYSWKGQNPDYVGLYAYAGADRTAVRRAGDRVGFLVGWDVVEQGGTSRGVNWCCSGVLLTRDLLLTNWHCGGLTSATGEDVWRDSAIDGRTCDRVLVNMAWDDGSTARDAACDKVEVKNRKLDYAIVRLRAVAGGTAALTTTRPLRLAAGRPTLGTALRVIHHAECKPKLVSHSCAVSEAARGAWDGSGGNSEFAHNCDTEGGSSGAPVFNERGELVGLHHLGFEAIPGDAQKRCDQKNKAVHIDAILADIKDQAPALHDEIRAALAGP